MRSLRIALFLTLVALTTSLMIVACSTTQDGLPTANTPDAPSDGDGIGPPDNPVDQNSSFTFDKQLSFVERFAQKTFGPEGGSIEVYFDGLTRTITFPARPTQTEWQAIVYVQKGTNSAGENLEMYTFEPQYLADIGTIELYIESDFAPQTQDHQGITYTLYREYAGEFTEYSYGYPDDKSTLSFDLNNSDKWAVIYDGADYDDDIVLQ